MRNRVFSMLACLALTFTSVLNVSAASAVPLSYSNKYSYSMTGGGYTSILYLSPGILK